MSKKHKTNHLRRPRPAASRPPRAHKLAHLPGCPYLQDPVLPSSDAERLNSLVEFFGLQGYEAMQIVELARVALDLCEAGGPDPIARQVMADLLCQAPYWDHLVSVSKDRRIYTTLFDDPVHADELVAAMKAGAPQKLLPPSLWWAVSDEDRGRGMFAAARVLLGALESALEHLTAGGSRPLLDTLRDDLAGEACELGDAAGHDPGRATGSTAS